MHLHFDFKDWERAFHTFYRRRLGEAVDDGAGEVMGFIEGDSSLVFVVSTDAYTSGYWIEKDGESASSNPNTKVYRKVSEVRALERRVRQARTGTVNASLGGIVT